MQIRIMVAPLSIMWVVRNQIRSIKITKIMMRRNQPRTITRMGMLLLGLPYFKPAFVLELWPLCSRATSTLQTPSHKHRANGSWEDRTTTYVACAMPGCGLCALSWSRGARGGGRGRRRRSRVGGHLVHHRVAVGAAAVDVGGQRRTAVGLLGAQHQQAQQPEAPSSTFKGGHKHAMREAISMQ